MKSTLKLTNSQISNNKTADSDETSELEYASFSSDEENVSTSKTVTDMPWILAKCLKNLTIQSSVCV